jgi:cytochrome P450
MDDAEIKDQVYTLLIAGLETTAVSMAWGVYWLLREPSVLEKLRDALRGIRDVESLVKHPYLQAVCSESLRIEPVVTDVARKCKKPFPLGEWTVPAGENVFVNMCLMLRDERIYPEPHRFRPERFLERKYGPAEFAPFGGGQRRCLGAAFAEAELAIALGTIALEWDLELASRDPERAVRRHITMGPKNGVRVRVRGKRRTEAKAPSVENVEV